MIKPLYDRVIVEPIAKSDKIGSIFVPETAQKEQIVEGIISAVGTGRLLENGQKAELDVKLGDRIWYAKYNGTELEIDGNKFVILPESHILAVG